jgi:hypothetical protein
MFISHGTPLALETQRAKQPEREEAADGSSES